LSESNYSFRKELLGYGVSLVKSLQPS